MDWALLGGLVRIFDLKKLPDFKVWPHDQRVKSRKPSTKPYRKPDKIRKHCGINTDSDVAGDEPPP